MLQSILKDMGEFNEPEIKKVPEEEPPKPGDAAKGTEPAEPPKPTESAPPAEPPKKGKKKATIVSVDPEIPAAQTPPAAPAPPPKEEKAKDDPDAAFVATLNEEQRAELEEAETAEKHFGDKYKGLRKKLLDWHRGLDAKIDSLKKENPERSLDDSDPEFLKILKTKPAVTAFDQRKVLLAVAEERAVERVRKEQAPKMADVETRTRAVEIAPTVNKYVDEFKSGTLDFVVEEGEKAKDTLATAARLLKEGKEVPEDLRLEASIVQDKTAQAQAIAREYTMLVNRATTYDKNNPVHAWILEFVSRQGEALANGPEELKVREGKTFLPREKFNALPPEKQARHWTHSHLEIMQLMGMNAYGDMKNALQHELETAEKKGLERRKAKPVDKTPTPTPATAETPPEETPGLKATPTKLKGVATTGDPSAATGKTADIDVAILFPT